MAKRRRKKNKVNVVGVLCTSLVLALSILFFGADSLGLEGFPTFGDLFGGQSQGQDAKGDPLDAPLSVHYIDVGQGSSVYINAAGKHILIDAGENDQGDTVVSYLKKQGVKTLDLAIGTHPHSDHIGGMDVVIQSFDVKQVILPKVSSDLTPTTRTYTDLLEAIAAKGLKVTVAKPGATYQFGDALFTLLSPSHDYTDLNNYSVVTRLDYGSTSFLFTGDASKEAENTMLSEKKEVDVDVLLCGHHGSSTATTAKFLEAVSPKMAVIQCGAGNSYGHPHSQVLKRLEKLKIPIYRNDTCGTIVITSDGAAYQVTTEKGGA